MSEESPRLGLPFILPGQAQKELFHNEALSLLDFTIGAAVEGAPVATAPPSPLLGQCWLVAAGAGGVWSGRDHCVAAWSEGGWRFVSPPEGFTVWDKGARLPRQWDGSAWSTGRVACAGLAIGGKPVVGARLPALSSPSGGTTIDAEARAVLETVIAALKSHGLTD